MTVLILFIHTHKYFNKSFRVIKEAHENKEINLKNEKIKKLIEMEYEPNEDEELEFEN